MNNDNKNYYYSKIEKIDKNYFQYNSDEGIRLKLRFLLESKSQLAFID